MDGFEFVLPGDAKPGDAVRIGVELLPRSPSPSIHTPPAEIDRTGETDVSDQLNDWFTALPDGATADLQGGLYRCENVLLLREKRRLTVEGNGATIFAETDGSGVEPYDGFRFQWPRGRRHVQSVDCEDLVLRNLSIVGAHPEPGKYVPALEGQHGLHFVGGRNIQGEGIAVTNVYGDFARIAGWCDGWTLRGFQGAGSGRQGISPVQCRSGLLEDFDIRDIARTAIDVEPQPGWGCVGLTIQDGVIGPYGLSAGILFSSGGGTAEFLRGPDGRPLRDDQGVKLLDPWTLAPLNVDRILMQRVHCEERIKVVVQDYGGRGYRGSHRFIDVTSDVGDKAPTPGFIFRRIRGVEVTRCGSREPARERERRPANALVYCCGCQDITVADNQFAGYEHELIEEDACSAG